VDLGAGSAPYVVRGAWGHLGSLHSHPYPSHFVIYIVLASSGTAFGSSVDSGISAHGLSAYFGPSALLCTGAAASTKQGRRISFSRPSQMICGFT
jgi:hypothetical protein